MAVRDVYLQPDAPDPVLDEAAVLAVVRRHVPAARAVVGVDESGGEARAYAVASPGGDLILKTQRPHRVRPRTSLAKEAFFLRHLAGAFASEPLPVPHVFGYGKDGPLEYLVLSRVLGAAAAGVPLTAGAREAVLRALGAVLARVHHAPQAPLRESGVFPDDRDGRGVAARVEGAFAAAVEALERRTAAGTWPLDRTPAEVAAAGWRALPVPVDPPLVALHSNPGPTHTLVDATSGAFTGLIDFGDAYVSRPAFDLVRWPAAADRATLLEGYAAAAPGSVDGVFGATWRVLSLLAELQAAARRSTQPDVIDGAAIRRALDAL